MLRDFVVALSLANLWFFNVWRLFLIRHPNSFPYYHWKVNPIPVLQATIIDVVLLALFLWIAVILARRSARPFLLSLARIVFLFVFFLLIANVFLNVLRSIPLLLIIDTLIGHLQFLLPATTSATLKSAVGIVAVIGVLILGTIVLHRLIYRRQQLVKICVSIVLILSPFVVVTFSRAFWQWIVYRSGEQFLEPTATAFPSSAESDRRVLWLIFDELDYRLTFVDRPASVKLPELDRLRNESIFATNAYPAAGDTVLTLPSVITGRFVSHIFRSAPNELLLTFGDNNERLPWSTYPNIFTKVRAMEINSGLAGWYHPYCRVIGRALTKCSWEAIGFLPNKEIAQLVSYSHDSSVLMSMRRLALSALIPEVARIFLITEDGSAWRKLNARSYVNIQEEAKQMAGDPTLQLIMIHYPIPHPPGIYDRTTQSFSVDRRSGYLDNLVLTDIALGELRREMEQRGLWEGTSVLITADHGLRAGRIWLKHPIWKPTFTIEDPAVTGSVAEDRVPFLLRIGGQSIGATYEPAFNNILSHDLLLALLSGEISTHSDATNWLDKHRTIGKSPFTEGDK